MFNIQQWRGAWFFVILGLGLIVSLTGLPVLGGEERHGPFAGMIGFALGEIFRQWHEVTAWLMLGLIGIHVAGVLIESGFYRENLIKAMIMRYGNTLRSIGKKIAVFVI